MNAAVIAGVLWLAAVGFLAYCIITAPERDDD